MTQSMRIMTESPLNAETPAVRLRSWITPNAVFFDRNQGKIPEVPVDLDKWALTIDGKVKKKLNLGLEQLQRLPKAMVANTLECSGNSRSLLEKKAPGNPWTIGGVGNAVWGGVWLRDLLNDAGLADRAAHVAFEGMDTPLGKAQIKFVRSIPIEKAMSSTLLAYEMNGDPLPLKHGYPLRALALGWTGANCVKWLNRISVMEKPFEGFFMDQVYRVFQKGEKPATGDAVTAIALKSIITQPLAGERLEKGTIVVLGAAYAGEGHVEQVEVSVDGGANWQTAEFIGPDEPFAWRQWQYVWQASQAAEHTIKARATDEQGRRQPETARWNFLGYGNNGVDEHAVKVIVE
ncbi:sulfite oxidase [Desulfosarcina sp.]|uniref:sulfite oxidase n=1 Tax=Desulfosarcina sp. TaxID=2027861 RepID=UPI0035624785